MDETDAVADPLRRALLANAAFSTVSGAAVLAFAEGLAAQLGVPWAWLLPALGVGLLVFAALLVATARRRPIDLRAAVAISAADGLWVAGSVALVWLDPTGTTTLGRWLVLGVADVVLLLALAQAWGIHRARGRTATPAEAALSGDP